MLIGSLAISAHRPVSADFCSISFGMILKHRIQLGLQQQQPIPLVLSILAFLLVLDSQGLAK